MQLAVLERLKLLEILPREGDITTIKICRDLREALSFKENEHAEFGIEVREPGKCSECLYEGYANSDDSCPNCKGGKFIKNGTQQIYWNIEAARDVDIEIKAKAMGLIVDSLKKLSKNGGVNEQHISLFEKFLPDGE